VQGPVEADLGVDGEVRDPAGRHVAGVSSAIRHPADHRVRADERPCSRRVTVTELALV